MADVLIAPAQTADELSLGAEESPPFFTPSPCAAGARSRANSKRDGYEPYGARIRASGGRGMGQQIWLADQNARSCRVICCADRRSDPPHQQDRARRRRWWSCRPAPRSCLQQFARSFRARAEMVLRVRRERRKGALKRANGSRVSPPVRKLQ